MLEVPFIEPPFEISARVISGRGMSLKIDHVWRTIAVAAAEKMIVADFVKSRCRSVGGDVSAQAAVFSVGIDDHRHRIPAHITLDATLDVAVAGIFGLSFNRDGVEVGRL